MLEGLKIVGLADDILETQIMGREAGPNDRKMSLELTFLDPAWSHGIERIPKNSGVGASHAFSVCTKKGKVPG